MSTKKVIIDADPGVGDAIAIALALSDPTLDVIAVTSTGGTTSGEQAFRNLQTLVSMLDPPRWPRLGWSSAPRAALPDGPVRSGILVEDGVHGLGDCEIIEALPHAPTDSFKLLADLVREWPGELTLLTLGPLTNLQLACERHPDFLQQLKALVCHGGALNAQGNVTAPAEFNIYADPEAARAILTSSATKTLVPLDTCQQFGLTFDQYDALEVDSFSRLGQFLSKTVPYALRESRNQLGREGVLLPEVVALAAIACPRLFERQSLRVDIESAGELTRGMTVFDRRGIDRRLPNIEVLTAVDTVGVRDYVTRLVRAADTA
ncbi:nucleoside hydrolase [Planctomicrobium piriforme]|uniref:Purine nucleosidase n=1 Tax=Planctomicrobium piriforme TaxID=1576369 RepID=A0A1I3QG95_9PLAN|nr:nucleoside hydrolase [Planctomicrobium piriforme]SFJ32387.1 purine nucleosidase [Planctomicrobium piriforme]